MLHGIKEQASSQAHTNTHTHKTLSLFTVREESKWQLIFFHQN